MHLRLITSFIIVLFLSGNSVFAQYEGEIRFNIYNPENQANENSQMDITFTKNRIFIDSNVSAKVMAGLEAQGVLVRHDLKDFVIITSNREALTVTKSDLEGLVNMMNRMQGKNEKTNNEPFPWEEKVMETGETRNIHGYNAHQFILKGDKNGDYASVWLTDEIVVDWGLLMEAWYAIGAKQIDREVPVEMVMNNQSFPLLVEAYENEQVVFKAESVSINENSFDRSKTQLSSSLKIIGLTDLMMNMFRQN